MEQKTVSEDELDESDEVELPPSPFTLAAEDILRHFFFTYWLNTGKFPPFHDLHSRVHAVDWFRDGQYACPGDSAMLRLYNQLKEEIQ